MPDSRFFERTGPFSLRQLADVAEAEIEKGDPDQLFDDVATLDMAGVSHISFFDNKAYMKQFMKSGAGACLVHPSVTGKAPAGMAVLSCSNPYFSYAKVARLFYPPASFDGNISSAATIDDTARIGKNCHIEAGVVIGPDVVIGDRCRIGANTVIEYGVILGEDSWVSNNVLLSFCIIGVRAVIHSGARIGQEGFGFARGPVHIKIPQLGRVVIGDDVEIGANTTVDRGSGPDTSIGDGTKIDNLVQIAHNVVIGKKCYIAALAGIAGSVKIGNFVMIGGQVGIAGHITIGDRVQLAAKTGVMRDTPAEAIMAGIPGKPIKEWFRSVALIDKLTKDKKR